MNIPFYKYQGTGNDFVIINSFNTEEFNLDLDQIKYICSRKFGVGSDGLIILRKSKDQDFKMDFYNPDGSQSFCGNGSRCAAHFAYTHNIIKDKPCFIEAIDGVHKAFICQDEVKIEMSSIGTIKVLNSTLNWKKIGDSFFLDTGSPHVASYVTSQDDLESILDYGKDIRYSEPYREHGVNVNLIHALSSSRIEMRTYERGVETETFSCGTGATACAIIHASHSNSNQKVIEVQTKGGELKVSFDKMTNGQFNNVYLIGPAKQIFNGQIEV